MERGTATLLILLLAMSSACDTAPTEQVVVGSKNFTEQILLSEMLAQQIEANPNLRAVRRFNLGGTLIAHEAVAAGKIDVYFEYTGTALTAVLGEKPSNDPAEVLARVRKGYAERFGLVVGEPLGFNNTFVIVVRGEDARRLKLEKTSDLAPHAPRWRPGFGYEFMERPDGYRRWVQTYGLKFGNAPRTMELGLLYRALAERQVDVVAGNSTDGVIASLDLTVLEDDRHYFPPYEAVPIVRREALERHPPLEDALRRMAGQFSEEEMRRMNYAVDSEHRDARVVAGELLRAKRLLNRGTSP
jgi:glycine betaine/choline ABC-type transport system substrate-binding protein